MLDSCLDVYHRVRQSVPLEVGPFEKICELGQFGLDLVDSSLSFCSCFLYEFLILEFASQLVFFTFEFIDLPFVGLLEFFQRAGG